VNKPKKTRNLNVNHQMMLKKIIILVFVAWFLMPFVLITDLYPFFRYGMFAEPLKPTQTTEVLQLLWQDDNSKMQLFKPDNIGLTDNHFGYLLRHYFYTNQIKQLCSQIHYAMLKKNAKTAVYWQARQLKISPQRIDTLIVAEWKPVKP